ncbi:MAG: helix-turn-helix domain-containing protein [Candidatus Omnitrophica bacterium]|nr:helix-turn-helix domain-containing protein [Candidatus Omnitrophota bacterium]
MSSETTLLAWLTQAGLDEQRANIYLAALSKGEATAADLAKELKMGRTTIYDNLRFLEERGFVQTLMRGKRKVFVPLHPKELFKKIESQKEQLKDLLPDFLAIYANQDKRPFVQLFTGPFAAREIYEDILQSAKGEYAYFSPAALTLQNIDRKYIEQWIGRRVKIGIKSRSLRVKSKNVPQAIFSEETKYLRQIKYLPEYVDLNSTIYIYGENVGVISTRKEGSCFIIHSSDMAYSLKQVFEFLWGIGSKS